MVSMQVYFNTMSRKHSGKKQNTTYTFGKDSFLKWVRPGKLKKYRQTSSTSRYVSS